MSAFKKFNRQDVYVTAYSAKKRWSASGSAISDYGIEVLRGVPGEDPDYLDSSTYFDNRYESLTWRSIDQLYYRGFVLHSQNSGSYDHFLQSSFTSASRIISNEIAVFSLPRNIVGTHVEPGTFILNIEGKLEDNYYGDDYCRRAIDNENQYVHTGGTVYGSSLNPDPSGDYIENEGNYVLETLAAGGEYLESEDPQYRRELIDDGQGRLYLSGSRITQNSETGYGVGDIIYTHGLAIITDPDIARYYTRYLDPVLDWKSNQPIYTYNYNCKVKDAEFIHTLNPSALSGSDGKIADNVSGSYFKPYVTSIGLYNDAQELIAVAKLGQPIPKSKDTDMTFVVTLDM